MAVVSPASFNNGQRVEFPTTASAGFMESIGDGTSVFRPSTGANSVVVRDSSSVIVQTVNGIGTTSADGISQINSTATTALNPFQYSPRSTWVSRYYSGGDKQSIWAFENRSGVATWYHNDNGAGFGSPLMALTKVGVLSVPNVTCSNAVAVGTQLTVAGLATFNGDVAMSALPTSDPNVANQLWQDPSTHVVYVSTGYTPSLDFSNANNSMYVLLGYL